MRSRGPAAPDRPGADPDGGGTLANQVRTRLSDAIVSGQLAPGTEIDEQDIARRFGASRTPVREALRELAASGLVILEPRRGARVVEMSLDRIGEMFEVMAETEATCVRLATWRITAQERAALSHVHAQSRAPAMSGDVDRYDVMNREFHAALYRATHNAFLAEHATILRRRLAPFRRAQLRGGQRLRLSYDEHAAILHDIFAGDGIAAATLMRAHMLVAGTAYADYTTRDDEGAAPR